MAVLIVALTEVAVSRRRWHGGALVLVILLSALFGAVPDGAGDVQRVLWLVGFVWLVSLGARGPARWPAQPAT